MAALLYAQVENGLVAERRIIDISSVPAHKQEMWKLVVSVGKDAAFAPATQIKTGPITTITATEVVDTWTVRNKTQGELADDAANAAVMEDARANDAIANVTGKVMFKMMNAIRVLQGQAQFTPAQFRAWFKAQQS